MQTFGWVVACGIFVALFYGGSFRRAFAFVGLLCVSLAMMLANPIDPPSVAVFVNNLMGAAVCALPFWWAFKKWRREHAR